MSLANPRASNGLVPKSESVFSFLHNISVEETPFEQFFSQFPFDETISIKLYGRKACLYRKLCFVSLSGATFGLLLLIAKWIPFIKASMTTKPCRVLDATHVFVVNNFGQKELLKLDTIRLKASAFNPFHSCIKGSSTLETIKTLNYRCNRFVLSPFTGRFVHIDEFVRLNYKTWQDCTNGLDEMTWEEQFSLFGPNLIDIKSRSLQSLVLSEFTNPFNMFQFASIIIWCSEKYYLYACVILLMTIVSSALTIYETRLNNQKIKSMARFTCTVTVRRSGGWHKTSSANLVPGDVFALDNSIEVAPCDLLLVNGDAIVDESMLTGESVPISKTHSLLENIYEPMSESEFLNSKHIIFAGTRLLRARPRSSWPCLGLAVRTGLSTVKGNLVQSIMFPRPNNFRFHRDSLVFIGFMTILAIIGFSISVVKLILLNVSFYYIVTRALDLITVVLPPALPATMSVGTVFALNRLKLNQIFCICPPKINVASGIKAICFDKTGTLTEEGLEIYAIIPSIESPARFCGHMTSMRELKNFSLAGQQLVRLMASCHSLKRINGKIVGDPLDIHMFAFTQWELCDSNLPDESISPILVKSPIDTFSNTNHEANVTILKSFDFSSTLSRMSVLALYSGNPNIQVLVKGSPESIKRICLPDSIPQNYLDCLAEYAREGYRVIACASKVLDCSLETAQSLEREHLEHELHFLGYILFENRLKPQSKVVLDRLRSANIKCIMATGDNILTAICVAKTCGLIPPNSILFFPSISATGRLAWEPFDPSSLTCTPNFENLLELPPEICLACTGEMLHYMADSRSRKYLNEFITKCLVYARMSPQQKQLLVELYQQINVCVGFCGDGANDIGALKAADIGISLSQAEASVAAPFTCRINDIQCVLTILREGRASLVTSFSSFKFMSLYSIVQFTSLTLLYTFGSSLSDGQFVYIDLFQILPLGVFMTRFEAAQELSTKKPTAKLISLPILASIMSQILLQTFYQILVFWFSFQSKVAINHPPIIDEANVNNLQTTMLALFSIFIYPTVALVYCAGRPYRNPGYCTHHILP